VLPSRRALFESVGSDGLELSELEETPLDEVHTLVWTSWVLQLRRESGRASIKLKSTFVLRRDQGEWRIVLNLNHQDRGKLFSSLATQAVSSTERRNL
jgi:hypothetical protein